MQIVITFNRLPSPELMVNKLRTIHWSRRAKIERVDRREGFYAARAVLESQDWKAPNKAIISYQFTVKNRRIKDVEGLLVASKPLIDGIVDGGVLKNDDCWHLDIGEHRS